jgi:P27 family predicted phage terminase small subunit
MQRFKARMSKRELAINGNSSRLALRKNEPDPLPTDGMRCPLGYSPLESEIWNNYFGLLKASSTLSAADGAILDVFSRTYSELIEMESYLKQHGKTYRITSGREFPRAEISIRNDCRREVKSLMIQLGITPASRGHVETVNGGDGDEIGQVT